MTMDRIKEKINRILGEGMYSGDVLADLLFEAPELVADTTFGLTDPENNKDFARKVLRKKKEVIEDSADYEIFRTGNQDGYIVLYVKASKSIGYLVRFETLKKKLTDTTVTQVALWRDPRIAYASGVTKKIFFGYLLREWPAVMSDQQQTTRGQEFWQTRMAEAVELGYKVGLADFNAHNVTWFTGTTAEFPTWLTEHNGWGEGSKFRALRYIIAN
jgi:hypothetical protein